MIFGIAERDGHAGEEELCRRILARHVAVTHGNRRGPHLPGKIAEIGDADPFHDDEGEMKGLRHEGEAEHRHGEPDRLADPHRRKEREHVAESLGDDAGDERGDRRAGRAGRDQQRAGEDEK